MKAFRSPRPKKGSEGDSPRLRQTTQETHQFSFRRILLSRILLLSVPVLLAGEIVTYRKARTGLLETARQNLSESAIRKAERIENSIQALQANLLTASETTALQSGSPEEAQKLIDQLLNGIPGDSKCAQLRNVNTGKPIAGNCQNWLFTWPEEEDWLPHNNSPNLNKTVQVTLLPSQSLPAKVSNNKSQSLPAETSDKDSSVPHEGSQLRLLFRTPVYDPANQLRGDLRLQVSLDQPGNNELRSLAGNVIIINSDGKILAHPLADRVGQNIQTQPNAKRLQIIVKKAVNIAKKAADDESVDTSGVLHLPPFIKNRSELLAGYTAIPSPLQSDRHWVILAVTPLDNALFGLQEIQVILFVLTLGLIGASLLATYYLARDLALPLERLRDYALDVQHKDISKTIPHNFKIREFNQLAKALDEMVKRLKAWAERLETAWKEAQAANQLKSEFLANTSHELRTPLNAIIGCVRTVLDDCCDDREEEREFLRLADNAAIHLLNIINDILDLSRIEAGTFSVVTEPIDLRTVLQEVMDLQLVRAQQKNLILDAPTLQSDPITVQADPAKLKQVLLNVVGNAIKFTEKGSVSIAVESEFSTIQSNDLSIQGNENQGNCVVVTVKDTGVGIEPEQQQKLFRPFVMVDGSTTRKVGGTGLGLAISRNLMELMGGSITLYSAGIGQGTMVKIKLPAIDMAFLSV